jgi:hypothetical protein
MWLFRDEEATGRPILDVGRTSANALPTEDPIITAMFSAVVLSFANLNAIQARQMTVNISTNVRSHP